MQRRFSFAVPLATLFCALACMLPGCGGRTVPEAAPAPAEIAATSAPAAATAPAAETLYQYETVNFASTGMMAHILRYIGPETETLVIPDTLEGLPVVSIASDAFGDAPWLKHLTLPELSNLPDGLFSGCANLETLQPAEARERWSAAFLLGTGQEGDYAYELYYDGAVLTDYTGEAETLTVPGELGGRPLRHVGSYAFRNNDALREITLPEGLVSIGEEAFLFCGELCRVSLPGSLRVIGEEAFDSCQTLQSIAFPENLRVIGVRAFAYSGLTSLSLPGSLEEIGCGAFYNTPWILEERGSWPEGQRGSWLTLGNGVMHCYLGFEQSYDPELPESFEVTVPAEYGDAFDFSCCRWAPEAVVIPEGAERVPALAFSGSYIRRVTLPESLRVIEDDAFKDAALEEISFARGLTSIGEFAFYGCKALTALTLPDTLAEIGDLAFSGCTALTEIVLPASLTKLNYAFTDCTGLESAILSPGMDAEDGCNYTFRDCTALRSVFLPGSLRRVTSLLEGCSALEEVEIGEGMEYIGWNAFAGCAALRRVSLPQSLISVDAGAFTGCTALTDITLYEGTEAEGAFADCPGTPTVLPREAEADGHAPGDTFYMDVESEEDLRALVTMELGDYGGAAGALYNPLTLREDTFLPDHYSLTVMDGVSLVVPDGVTLSVRGTICLWGGSLIVEGALVNEGLIVVGDIDFNGTEHPGALRIRGDYHNIRQDSEEGGILWLQYGTVEGTDEYER